MIKTIKKQYKTFIVQSAFLQTIESLPKSKRFDSISYDHSINKNIIFVKCSGKIIPLLATIHEDYDKNYFNILMKTTCFLLMIKYFGPKILIGFYLAIIHEGTYDSRRDGYDCGLIRFIRFTHGFMLIVGSIIVIIIPLHIRAAYRKLKIWNSFNRNISLSELQKKYIIHMSGQNHLSCKNQKFHSPWSEYNKIINMARLSDVALFSQSRGNCSDDSMQVIDLDSLENK